MVGSLRLHNGFEGATLIACSVCFTGDLRLRAYFRGAREAYIDSKGVLPPIGSENYMNTSEKAFMMLAVRRLLDKIKRGDVELASTAPDAERELAALRFDKRGEPRIETIGPAVRALASGLIGRDLEQEAQERIRTSPVHQFLDEPVPVTSAILKECVARKSFSQLTFEIYKETVTVLAVCSRAHTGSSPQESVLQRDQAICAGLLVRIVKFMTAVASLVSQDSNRADVVFALNRSIAESATNLRFLLIKNEDRFFDQFVRFSLAPERRLYDLIEENVAKRSGETLPIEERMLKSIQRVCRLSRVKITDVQPRMGDWGGGLRNRMMAIGQGELYAGVHGLASQAVHGTWVDLVQHHLAEVDGGFRPDPTWSRVDSRLMLPTCVLVLTAAHTYINQFFPPLPELEPLLDRISDLEERIMVVDQAHEEWFSSRTSDIK